MNDSTVAERQRGSGERPHIGSARPIPSYGPDRGAKLLRRVPIVVILVMWLAQLGTLTLSRYMAWPEMGMGAIGPRLGVTLFGILCSIAVLTVLRVARRTGLLRRIAIAAALAILGALLQTLANLFAFRWYYGSSEFDPMMTGLIYYDYLMIYTSLSVVILAMTYAADIADREDTIAALRARADAFQLRALRFQLNPHFLFNTLNSIASLIRRRDNDEAEAMVESLSEFLRSTLRIDPGVEITLGEEIGLQSLYLAIERSRFPHRLRVSIEIPHELHDACVPNLILQPLVENAIKHGVARSERPVHLEVFASADAGRLRIEVRDDGGDAPLAAATGSRIGLANVAERLRAHFGEQASFEAGPRAGGGFSARITLPLRHAA